VLAALDHQLTSVLGRVITNRSAVAVVAHSSVSLCRVRRFAHEPDHVRELAALFAIQSGLARLPVRDERRGLIDDLERRFITR
jgi:hypothetical protein